MVLANLHRASSFYAEISSIASASAYYLMPCITHTTGVDHVRSLCSCCLDGLEVVHSSFTFDPLNFSHTSDEHTTARHTITKGKSIYNTDTVVSGTMYRVNYHTSWCISNIVSHHYRLVSNCILWFIPARCMLLYTYSIFPSSSAKSEDEKASFTSKHLKPLLLQCKSFRRLSSPFRRIESIVSCCCLVRRFRTEWYHTK